MHVLSTFIWPWVGRSKYTVNAAIFQNGESELGHKIGNNYLCKENRYVRKELLLFPQTP